MKRFSSIFHRNEPHTVQGTGRVNALRARRSAPRFHGWSVLAAVAIVSLLGGCAGKSVVRVMDTTAYCGCAICCSWERGSWTYLKLDFWNRYVSAGPQSGRPYSGLTARGTSPHEPAAGLFSWDTVERPWMLPLRLLPWSWFPEDGTIAADTRYYPFGTRMYVPGYGWGTVEDRGGAIKGRDRIDLFFDSHDDALLWGRKKVEVRIEYP